MTKVVRPIRSAWTRPAGPAVVAVVLGIALMVWRVAFGTRYREGFGWFGVAAVGVLLAVPVLCVLTYLVRRRRMRLAIEGDGLAYRDPRGNRMTIDATAVRSVHDLVVHTRLEQGGVTVVAGQDGGALLTLWHKTWNRRDLTRLWSELGWPLRAAEELPIETARTRFPGLRLPVGFTNPGRTGLLATVVMIGYVASWVITMVIVTG